MYVCVLSLRLLNVVVLCSEGIMHSRHNIRRIETDMLINQSGVVSPDVLSIYS